MKTGQSGIHTLNENDAQPQQGRNVCAPHVSELRQDCYWDYPS